MGYKAPLSPKRTPQRKRRAPLEFGLHQTEWKQFRELDPAKLAALVANPTIIDGRNALDPTLWRKAGWTYRALGRPRIWRSNLIGSADLSSPDCMAPMGAADN